MLPASARSASYGGFESAEARRLDETHATAARRRAPQHEAGRSRGSIQPLDRPGATPHDLGRSPRMIDADNFQERVRAQIATLAGR